ncbi:MAG: hypothetical protein QM605_15380 [Sphingobium sp.]
MAVDARNNAMTLLRHLDHHAAIQPPEAGNEQDMPVIAPARSEPLWERSTRYADQPMGLQTRLFGIGGVMLVCLLIVGGALFTWRTYTAPPATQTLSVFDVAPPAATGSPASQAARNPASQPQPGSGPGRAARSRPANRADHRTGDAARAARPAPQ